MNICGNIPFGASWCKAQRKNWRATLTLLPGIITPVLKMNNGALYKNKLIYISQFLLNIHILAQKTHELYLHVQIRVDLTENYLTKNFCLNVKILCNRRCDKEIQCNVLTQTFDNRHRSDKETHVNVLRWTIDKSKGLINKHM